MLQRVFILRGVLLVGYPSLDFVLRRKDDGTQEIFDYRGQAYVGERTVNILRHGDHGPVSEYLCDEAPTPESVEFCAGFEHAMNQKRRVQPGQKASDSFRHGWRAGWTERRPIHAIT